MSMKIFIVGLLGAVLACQPGQDVDAPASGAREQNVETAGQIQRAESPGDDGGSGTASTTAGKVTVLFFGTSLTAGFGLDPSQAFPNLISRTAASAGLPITAINAGLSGETSAGALRRIDWTLRRPVDVVVLETGGNDALRALNADSLEANLSGIVSRIKAAQPNARILLAAMEAPPNLGARYTARFRLAYVEVARRERLTLVPFLLRSRGRGRAEPAGWRASERPRRANCRGERVARSAARNWLRAN